MVYVLPIRCYLNDKSNNKYISVIYLKQYNINWKFHNLRVTSSANFNFFSASIH